MEIRKLIHATLLTLVAGLSTPVFANSISFDSDVLYNNPSLNRKLETGDYDFAAQHSQYGSSFKDRWKFTVAEDSTASINVNDLEVDFSKASSPTASNNSRYSRRSSLRNASSAKPSSFRQSRRSSLRNASSAKPSSFRQSRRSPRQAFNTSKIFDTQNLTFRLLDYKGNLIGEAGENGILSGLDLIGGKWYTIQVSGKVNGFFGSAYYGVLKINPTPAPVPLGNSAPLLGSALALLALRLRKRYSRTAA